MKFLHVKRLTTCALMVTLSLSMPVQVLAQLPENVDEKANEEELENEKHPGGYDFSNFSLSVLSTGDQRHSSTFECFMGGVTLGFIHGIDEPQNVSLKMGRSVEVGLTDIIGVAYNLNPKNAFSVGFGLLWRNYRMMNHYRFLPATDGNIAVEPYPEGANPKFSRLHTLHMTLPLHYIHRFPNGMDFLLGPEFAFNAGCNKHTRTIKTRYTLDGKKYKEMYRDVHVQNSMVSIMAALSWKQLGFYMRYTPSSAFDTDFGPDFQSLSMGMMFLW